MRLSPLLQGGSSIWSHLMKINTILSLSHLPRRETAAAFSDNCSCLKLSSLCRVRLTCFCPLCKPESRQKLSSDRSSQATFAQHCHQEKEMLFLCVLFRTATVWKRGAVRQIGDIQRNISDLQSSYRLEQTPTCWSEYWPSRSTLWWRNANNPRTANSRHFARSSAIDDHLYLNEYCACATRHDFRRWKQ